MGIDDQIIAAAAKGNFSLLIDSKMLLIPKSDCNKFLAWVINQKVTILGAEGFLYNGSTGDLRVVESAVLDSSPGVAGMAAATAYEKVFNNSEWQEASFIEFTLGD